MDANSVDSLSSSSFSKLVVAKLWRASQAVPRMLNSFWVRSTMSSGIGCATSRPL